MDSGPEGGLGILSTCVVPAPGVGPGLPVLAGRLDVETRSVQGGPLASEALLSVALSSYAGASLSSSLNSIY